MEFDEYVEQGIRLFQEDEFDTALKHFELALQIQPNHEEILNIIEVVKLQKKNSFDRIENNHKKNKIAIEDFIKTNRNIKDSLVKKHNASNYYRYSLAFTSLGEFPAFIEDYCEIITIMPVYPLTFSIRGWAKLQTGDYDEAIEEFEKAVQHKPEDDQFKQNLADAYLKRGMACDINGDPAGAAADFEAVLKYKPENKSVYELLLMAREKEPVKTSE